MKEVWQEIMSAVSVKTLLVTLLYISIFLYISGFYFYNSFGFAPHRDEIKKNADIVVTHDQIISTQTNFTQ